MFKILIPGLAAMVFSPVGALAQESGWSWSLNPRVGYFSADKSLGALAPEGPILSLASSPTAGFAIGVQTPWNWLALRGIVEQTLDADLLRQEVAGTESCGRKCTRFLHSYHPFAEGSSVMNLAVSMIISPFADRFEFQPYVLGGAGLKRYDLGSGAWQADPRYLLGGRQAGFSLHAGAGVEVPVGRTRVTLEAVDYVSGFWTNTVTPTEPAYSRTLSHRAMDRLGHDFFFSIGLKVPLFER